MRYRELNRTSERPDAGTYFAWGNTRYELSSREGIYHDNLLVLLIKLRIHV